MDFETSGNGQNSGSGSNKRPLDNSGNLDRTPLSKRPNIVEDPVTDIIRVEVSKVIY